MQYRLSQKIGVRGFGGQSIGGQVVGVTRVDQRRNYIRVTGLANSDHLMRHQYGAATYGAIAGAAVFGGFVTFLCNALQEPSDPSCLGSSLLGIGMGAGIGAAAGAGIDALAQRSPQPRAVPILRKRW